VAASAIQLVQPQDVRPVAQLQGRISRIKSGANDLQHAAIWQTVIMTVLLQGAGNNASRAHAGGLRIAA